jgi:hypothetical protein
MFILMDNSEAGFFEGAHRIEIIDAGDLGQS